MRPPSRHRQYRELKKLIFLAPSKCPIDLFGPVANGMVLTRLLSHRENLVCLSRLAHARAALQASVQPLPSVLAEEYLA